MLVILLNVISRLHCENSILVMMIDVYMPPRSSGLKQKNSVDSEIYRSVDHELVQH